MDERYRMHRRHAWSSPEKVVVMASDIFVTIHAYFGHDKLMQHILPQLKDLR